MTVPGHSRHPGPPGRRGHPGAARRGSRPRWLLHVPFAAVMLIVLIGFVRIGQYHWRQGSTLLAASLLLAAALRAALPDDRLGLIAIRSRAVDVLSYAAFGAAMALLALTIQGGPFD